MSFYNPGAANYYGDSFDLIDERTPELNAPAAPAKNQYAQLADRQGGACYFCSKGTNCLLTFPARKAFRNLPAKDPWSVFACPVCVHRHRLWSPEG